VPQRFVTSTAGAALRTGKRYLSPVPGSGQAGGRMAGERHRYAVQRNPVRSRDLLLTLTRGPLNVRTGSAAVRSPSSNSHTSIWRRSRSRRRSLSERRTEYFAPGRGCYVHISGIKDLNFGDSLSSAIRGDFLNGSIRRIQSPGNSIEHGRGRRDQLDAVATKPPDSVL